MKPKDALLLFIQESLESGLNFLTSPYSTIQRVKVMIVIVLSIIFFIGVYLIREEIREVRKKEL